MERILFQHTFIILLLFVFFCSSPVHAESVLETSEASVGKTLRNYRLVDQHGRHFPLHSLKGRPVLMNFMYIDCPDMCVLTGISLQGLLEVLPDDLKKELVILSVSIEPEKDTPEKLLRYGERFTDDFNTWSFTTTSEETLEMMIRDMGFTYRKTDMGIEHLNRITLLDLEGRVAKHFYGTDFDNEEIIKNIRLVVDNKPLGSSVFNVVNDIRLYCSNYDPITKIYKLDYGFIIASAFQILFVFVTLFFLVRFLRGQKSGDRKQESEFRSQETRERREP